MEDASGAAGSDTKACTGPIISVGGPAGSNDGAAQAQTEDGSAQLSTKFGESR